MVAWITVRHHRASVGKHWRTGVFFRHPIEVYRSEALIQLRTDRQLMLQVRAPSPDLFFNVLRDSIENLLVHRFPGLTYRLFVPCPTNATLGGFCPEQFSLDGLIRLREHGKTVRTCDGCVIDYDISFLLTGFAMPSQPLRHDLDNLRAGLSEVSEGVEALRRYAAATDNAVRRMLRAATAEVDDCPRLFTIRERTPGVMRKRQHRIVLWCEHPGQWHPWAPATYDLRQSPSWLVRIGPYASLVLKTLRVVVPIAARLAGVVFSEEQVKASEREMDLMMAVVDKLPGHIADGEQWELESEGPSGALTLAEGQALRALRQLVWELDPARAFGDLRRVQSPAGDYLWVCRDHYVEYNPGLPTVP